MRKEPETSESEQARDRKSVRERERACARKRERAHERRGRRGSVMRLNNVCGVVSAENGECWLRRSAIKGVSPVVHMRAFSHHNSAFSFGFYV